MDDMVELQESVDGHGEGGAAEDALSDLFKRGLSAPESVLDCRVRLTGGEDELEEGGGWGGCLSATNSFSWMFSCRTAWDRA